jgi:hypothetical protein
MIGVRRTVAPRQFVGPRRRLYGLVQLALVRDAIHDLVEFCENQAEVKPTSFSFHSGVDVNNRIDHIEDLMASELQLQSIDSNVKQILK